MGLQMNGCWTIVPVLVAVCRHVDTVVTVASGTRRADFRCKPTEEFYPRPIGTVKHGEGVVVDVGSHHSRCKGKAGMLFATAFNGDEMVKNHGCKDHQVGRRMTHVAWVKQEAESIFPATEDLLYKKPRRRVTKIEMHTHALGSAGCGMD